jgi:hypothetical protein
VSKPSQIDTFVVLTNTTDTSLDLHLILRDADGVEVEGSPVALTLGPHASAAVSLSALF